MTRNLILVLTATFLMIIYSCKKSTPSAPDAIVNQFTFKGTTYKGTGAEFIYDGTFSTYKLAIIDSVYNYIYLAFKTIPTVNKVYTLSQYLSPLDPSACFIKVIPAAPSLNYNSTGLAGNTVNVTISGGKVVASFSNVSVSDGTTTTTVSGTLTQTK